MQDGPAQVEEQPDASKRKSKKRKEVVKEEAVKVALPDPSPVAPSTKKKKGKAHQEGQ